MLLEVCFDIKCVLVVLLRGRTPVLVVWVKARTRVNERKRHCGKANEMNGTKRAYRLFEERVINERKKFAGELQVAQKQQNHCNAHCSSPYLYWNRSPRSDFKTKQLFGLTVRLSSPQSHVRCMHYVIQLAEMLWKMSYTCWRHT